jgi:hypothetical protein
MLRKILDRLIRIGRLTVVAPDGTKMHFGEVPKDEPQLDVVVRLKGAVTPLKLAVHPDLYLGEAYMDGALVIERGSLWDLLDLCGRNLRLRGARSNRLVRAGKAIMRGFNNTIRFEPRAATWPITTIYRTACIEISSMTISSIHARIFRNRAYLSTKLSMRRNITSRPSSC